MTAVMPRSGTAPTRGTTSVPSSSSSASLYTWVLSVRDWQVHALADPAPDPPGGMLATRCGGWHPVACPVTVARRGELCPRCAATGLVLLELLCDRTAR